MNNASPTIWRLSSWPLRRKKYIYGKNIKIRFANCCRSGKDHHFHISNMILQQLWEVNNFAPCKIRWTWVNIMWIQDSMPHDFSVCQISQEECFGGFESQSRIDQSKWFRVFRRTSSYFPSFPMSLQSFACKHGNGKLLSTFFTVVNSSPKLTYQEINHTLPS
jgi:hypothetical protein